METNGITNFGIHYMLDGYGADFDILNDRQKIQQILEELPEKMEMHTICDTVIAEVGPNNKKDPGGISGFVMIAESHISIHSFPARGFVSIDVYTCNDTLDNEKLTAEFKKFFNLKEVEEHLVKRGTKYPAEDIY